MPRRSFSVKVDLTRLQQIPGIGKAAVREEMGRVALDLLSEAVREAPVRDGILRGSGSAHVSGKRIATGADFGGGAGTPVQGGAGTADKLEAVVVFNTIYATYQHEMTDLKHPKGGKAKYLSDPLERNRAQYERKIAEAITRATT